MWKGDLGGGGGGLRETLGGTYSLRVGAPKVQIRMESKDRDVGGSGKKESKRGVRTNLRALENLPFEETNRRGTWGCGGESPNTEVPERGLRHGGSRCGLQAESGGLFGRLAVRESWLGKEVN